MRGNNGVIVFRGFQNSVAGVKRRTTARVLEVPPSSSPSIAGAVRVQGVSNARGDEVVGRRQGQGVVVKGWRRLDRTLVILTTLMLVPSFGLWINHIGSPATESCMVVGR